MMSRPNKVLRIFHEESKLPVGYISTVEKWKAWRYLNKPNQKSGRHHKSFCKDQMTFSVLPRGPSSSHPPNRRAQALAFPSHFPLLHQSLPPWLNLLPGLSETFYQDSVVSYHVYKKINKKSGSMRSRCSLSGPLPLLSKVMLVLRTMAWDPNVTQ